MINGDLKTAISAAKSSIFNGAFYFPDQSGNSEEWGSDCLLGEIMVFRGALPDVKRQRIEGYLSHKWGLANQLPTDHYYSDEKNIPESDLFFEVDGNGTIRSLTKHDYEMESNLSVIVRATDASGHFFDKNLSIEIGNINEDIDTDGIEDHADLDMDGDGLSNLDELKFNSDPKDASDPLGENVKLLPSLSFQLRENSPKEQSSENLKERSIS